MRETGKSRRYAGSAAIAIAAGAFACAVARAANPPAALTKASLAQSGPVRELRFGFQGGAPRWKISAHGQELWIDLPHCVSEVPPRPLFGRETAPLEAVRVLETAGAVRIAVQVDGKIDFAIARLRRHIVLRVAPAGAAPNLAAALLTMRESPARGARSAPQRAEAGAVPRAAAIAPAAAATARSAPIRGHPLVMIDPGHGGFDPGTSSASGLQEKTLALEIALRLRAALEARGISVAMTRTTDVFIPLAGRTRIANEAGADLFVSIHLNSSPNPAASGIEVYYLNNTTDRATIRLARMENAQAGGGYGALQAPNLNYILTDLRQNYKANEAVAVARMIDAQAVADLDANFNLEVGALGAKMGPFYVLVGARMPAVLVECGFLSNPAEAQRLESARYQQVLAGAIAAAIAHYFNADAAVGNL